MRDVFDGKKKEPVKASPPQLNFSPPRRSTALTTPLIAWPYSASNVPVTTWTSSSSERSRRRLDLLS